MAAFVKGLLHRCCPCRYESSGEDVRPKTVNIVVGFFWLVNVQVGTGFLGIPFSFGHGGLIAGAAVLVVIAFVSWITGIWILEVTVRAQVYYNIYTEELSCILGSQGAALLLSTCA